MTYYGKMQLDRTLAREIKTSNGDGGRDAKFALLGRVRAAQKDLSTPQVCSTFGEILRKHGRAPVALCVAATLYARAERIDRWGFSWAAAVLDQWTTRPLSYIGTATIDDGLHPTRICEYAGEFIRLTTEG